MMHLISTLLIICISAVGVIRDIDIYNYHGALVVDFWKPAFQINGIIFGGLSDHEYGHYLQQQILGNKTYYYSVAIPSMIANITTFGLGAIIGVDTATQLYFSLPWEAEATRLGKQFIPSY